MSHPLPFLSPLSSPPLSLTLICSHPIHSSPILSSLLPSSSLLISPLLSSSLLFSSLLSFSLLSSPHLSSHIISLAICCDVTRIVPVCDVVHDLSYYYSSHPTAIEKKSKSSFTLAILITDYHVSYIKFKVYYSEA